MYVQNGIWNILQNHLTSELHRAYIKKRRLFAYASGFLIFSRDCDFIVDFLFRIIKYSIYIFFRILNAYLQKEKKKI